jgi:hypothetical protein
MARIITYEDDPNISDLDRLIGSDGNDYNITKNFTLLGIAEYVIDVFVNPDATDFHIPVFNSNGTRITDSIMHQDSSPSNGVAGTIITVDGNFSVIKDTTLGVTIDDTTIIPSTLRLRGKVSDKNDNFGVANQILTSDENGYVQWGPECGNGYVLGQGTLHYLPLWTPNSGTIGDSLAYQNGDNDTPATEIYFKGGLASEGSKVSNITDIALGNKNFAGGEGSAAFNFRSIALGNDSFASGHRGISGGHGSFTAGYNVGAGNDGFGKWNADYTDATVLELTLISGSINAGDYLIANTGDDPSAKVEILSVQYPTNILPYEITIATPISVNLDQAFAIETATPDRSDQQATIAIGFQSASKGFGAAAIGYDAVADAIGAVALGKDALADQANQVAIGSGNVKLDGTAQDDTQDKVLVIDANTSIVKYRSALTISPELGWDTVDYSTGNQNWIVDKYNGYMEIPFGVIPPAKREVRPANLTTGEEGYFVFVANSVDIPADFLDFTSVNSGNINKVRTTWSGSGTRTYIPNNQNAGKWVTGTVVKFHYIVREEGGVPTIFWDACCEIQALNDCPVITSPSVSHTINEDQAFSGGLPATDGDGPSALAWSIVAQPDNGTVSLNAATGDYTYTPDTNYFGSDGFTWQVFDGGCYSAVGSVSFTINEVVESPSFKISNGLGNNCGADDVAPLYTGTAGGTYKWEGHYCDPDHAAADVTITTFYDVGGSWVAGLPANWTFAKDDVSGVSVDYRFTLESSNVASGLTRIELRIEDAGGNVGSPYTLEIGAAFDTLTKTEILLDYSGTGTNNIGGDWIYPGVTYDNIWDGKGMENLSTDTYNGHTVLELATATGVSPSGGTLAALYPSATFTIQKIRPGTGGGTTSDFLEFYYTCIIDSGALAPTSNNIDPGLTIEFDAATLNTAFGKTGTGDLIWTLEVEDILRAPLATGNITNISPTLTTNTHTCNDGGMALIAWGYDTAGLYHSFLLRRFDIANNQGSPYEHQGTAVNQFFASKSWTPPYAYISTPAPVAGQCTTATSTWWFRGGAGWQLDATDVDESNAGAIWDKNNNLANLPNQSGTGQNNYSYIPAVQHANYTASNCTAGLYRMDTTTAATIASTITSGKINFMVVGLGFANNINGQATCDPTKEYQAWVHGDACQMRIFTENAGSTNQIEIKDNQNSFIAGDGKYVEIDVYATPGSNATVFSF